ncbi:MAG: hypothetical protein HYX74_12025 [Acidobacteria bacterium]|nr:hypothetical protein [Acidobacteriota bacterium]
MYVQRGDAVEARYRSYIATLEMYHEKLRTALRSEAPDLAKRLAGEPAKPIPYGYQLAPRLVADATPGPRTRPASNSYSWRRTDEFIDGQLARLAGAEKKLEETSKLLPAERRPGYEPMVGDYGELAENQRRIDQHVQYNRFWQKTIAGDRPRFDRSTLFHDAVVEREKILDELQRADLAPEQRVRVEAREKELYRQIAQEKEGFSAPPFLDLKRPNRRLWIVRVPLYSDIQDKQFLREAKKAIEAVWRFKDEEVEFRVSVDYRIVSPEKLYRPDPAPAAGTHLDLDSHVKRFPNNGGVLTTGANSTYAISGRYIALGPGEIARNVLAHEFGHILGFNDGYFRGYRDGGADGFEVLEIVPDPDDLMCNPGGGKVQRAHFEKLVAALQSRFQRTGSGSVKK